MPRRNYTFDANNQLSDAGGAIAAAGWAQVGGAQAIVDLGGNQGVTITLPSIDNVSSLTPQQARIDGVVVIYVTAATISGSNLYRVTLVGSNNASLASGNHVLGQLQFGKGSAMDPPNASDETAVPGSTGFPQAYQYELLFTNEYEGTPLQYVGLYVSGTFGSITFSAFVAVLPRE